MLNFSCSGISALRHLLVPTHHPSRPRAMSLICCIACCIPFTLCLGTLQKAGHWNGTINCVYIPTPKYSPSLCLTSHAGQYKSPGAQFHHGSSSLQRFLLTHRDLYLSTLHCQIVATSPWLATTYGRNVSRLASGPLDSNEGIECCSSPVTMYSIQLCSWVSSWPVAFSQEPTPRTYVAN
jgi:hypothetical protein